MRDPEPTVEVVYARPDRQRVVTVPWRAGMTALDAVRASALLEEFPELAASALLLGVFGRRVDAEQEVSDGDRVEIYRPLKFDPREARRRAAQAAKSPRGARRSGHRS